MDRIVKGVFFVDVDLGSVHAEVLCGSNSAGGIGHGPEGGPEAGLGVHLGADLKVAEQRGEFFLCFNTGRVVPAGFVGAFSCDHAQKTVAVELGTLTMPEIIFPRRTVFVPDVPVVGIDDGAVEFIGERLFPDSTYNRDFRQDRFMRGWFRTCVSRNDKNGNNEMYDCIFHEKHFRQDQRD